jgi:hypothetical protein
MNSFEVDVWVRGTPRAVTHELAALSKDVDAWTEADVRTLLSEMLRALERERNPGGDPPPVTLRGFSWIVSAAEAAGVVVHLEMQLGTASAGPFAIDEARLTAMVTRVMKADEPVERVH